MKLSLFKEKSPPVNFSYFPNISNNRSKIIEIVKKNPNNPLFITDTSIIKNRLRHIPKSIKVAYSFKTNYDIAKNFTFSMIEVVSKYELDMALKQNYSYSSIIFNGPHKGNLHHLLSKPLIINIDNFTELDSLLKYPKNIKSKIGIRVNSTLNPSHFGFNIESGEAQNAISLLQLKQLPLSGLHVHIGGDIHSPKTYQKYSICLKNFINQKNFPLDSLEYIDFGGGYPSHSITSGTNTQFLPDIEKYLDSIILPLKPILNSKVNLIIEPGRYLVDDSTILISKIVDSKLINNIQTITLNSTINMLPSAWYHQLIIKGYHQNFIPSKFHSPINTKIYGCSCQESDLLYQGKIPFLLKPNDYLIFYCVGAYNQSQSSNFIFPNPKSFFI